MTAALNYRMDQVGTAQIMRITGTASYPTGGYDLAESFVVNTVDRQSPLVGLNDGGTNIALVDTVNKKVKFIVAATGLEVANATNVSAVTVSILVP